MHQQDLEKKVEADITCLSHHVLAVGGFDKGLSLLIVCALNIWAIDIGRAVNN